MEYHIRLATANDSPPLVALLKEHARFEGHDLQIKNQMEVLRSGRDLPIFLFVVECSGKLGGYMSLIKQFSTWNMGWYLFLDCLYLAPELRGKGIGKQLMQEAHSLGKQMGVDLMQWQTPAENHKAIGFYKGLGAFEKPKKRFFWKLKHTGC